MDSPLEPSSLPAIPPDEDFSDTGHIPPTSSVVVPGSSPQATAPLITTSENLLLSTCPDPANYAGPLARKEKMDQIEDVSRDVGRRIKSCKNSICDECRKIDFDKVVRIGSTNRNDTRGVEIQKVGKRFREESLSGCVLCQILFKSRLFDDKDFKERVRSEEDELRAFYFLSNTNLIGPHFLDSEECRRGNVLQCLAIVPSSIHSVDFSSRLSHFYESGCSIVYRDGDARPEMYAVRNISAQFDSILVKSWLDYCREHHENLCSKSTHMVNGLRLIDCEELVVKKANIGDVYVALSYVWASSNSKNASKDVEITRGNNQLPLPPSAVITDAITVTKLLGFRYLWIDKFCIDQDDPDTKHDQIKQMGFVYENAEVTIVAAAGDDENDGLPGVGAKSRKAQLSAKIGNFKVLSSTQDPHSSIRHSKWSTRGWTFQEAMLSRRRLVFTEEQVYFECNAMNCYGSVFVPFQVLHTEDKSKQRDCFRAGVFGRNGDDVFGSVDFDTLSRSHVFDRYWTAIEEYSSRKLTYEVDSLDAFIGVTRKCQEVRHPYRHIWGLPYLSSIESIQARDYFVNSLTWVHTQDCWSDKAVPRRRAGFPSWTWCGWAGEVSIRKQDHSSYNPFQFSGAIGAIHFVDEAERILDFSQMAHPSCTESRRSSTPPVLVLEALPLPSKNFSYDSGTNTWKVSNMPAQLNHMPAQLNLSQGPSSPADFSRELREGSRWQFIVLGVADKIAYIMILEKHNSFVSRAGIVLVEDLNENVLTALILFKDQKRMFRIK